MNLFSRENNKSHALQDFCGGDNGNNLPGKFRGGHPRHPDYLWPSRDDHVCHRKASLPRRAAMNQVSMQASTILQPQTRFAGGNRRGRGTRGGRWAALWLASNRGVDLESHSWLFHESCWTIRVPGETNKSILISVEHEVHGTTSTTARL